MTILAFPKLGRDGRGADGESCKTESNPHIDKAVLSRAVEMVEASCSCVFHLECGLQPLYMFAAPIDRSCVCNHVQFPWTCSLTRECSYRVQFCSNRVHSQSFPRLPSISISAISYHSPTATPPFMLDPAAGKDKLRQCLLRSGRWSGQRLGVPDSGAQLRDYWGSIGERTDVGRCRRRQAPSCQEGRMGAL